MKPCILWEGCATRGGYGTVTVEGRTAYIHRLACELYHGPPPFAKAVALHSCDTPACYEPSHLRWGTYADNMRDAAEKGRLRIGERHPMAKLTDKVVSDIRARFAAGERQHVLRREYGVSKAHVSRICLGQRRPTVGENQSV